MAQDIKELLKKDTNHLTETMPEGHDVRFLDRLDAALPQQKTPKKYWLQIAATIVVLLGFGFGIHNYFKTPEVLPTVVDTDTPEISTKSLGDISPDFKKVEDYYLANINLELSKVTLTSENKDLIDGYISQLEALNTEYKQLSIELTNSGPNELTVNALITNLKLRLNLLYRLKEQLNTLNNPENHQEFTNA